MKNTLNWNNKEHRKLLEETVLHYFNEFSVLRSGHGTAGWIMKDHFVIDYNGWSFIARWPDDGRKNFQLVSVRCPDGNWLQIEGSPYDDFDNSAFAAFFWNARADLKVLPKMQRELSKPRGSAFDELKERVGELHLLG